MKKPFKYSSFSRFCFLLLIVFVSCHQPADVNSDKSNSENRDTSGISHPVLNEEKTNHFDSVIIINDTNPEAVSYLLDCNESRINWYCVTHTGYVKFNKGRLLFADGNIIGGDFEICMDSISNIDIDYLLMKEVLVNSLKSEDFFDIKTFPTAVFNIARVKKITNDSFEVVGNLTIKDITRQIRFHSNIQIQDSLILVESERFPIDRTKWGITIYSENYEQTDKSFLFTDLVEIQISVLLKIK